MFLLPKKVGAFTLLRKLGTGGVAESYVGSHDEGDGRPVVVRRILPYVLRDPSRLASIEARVNDLVGVRHPFLVHVFDHFALGDEHYVVEEHVDGVNLDKVLSWSRQTQRALPHNVFLNIATQVCNGLEALHGRPGKGTGSEHVLHLGLKPGAVFLTRDGKVMLGSFGLTRSPTTLPSGGVSGPVPARMEYLSPEQTHPDQKLGPASDIFSLGAILYELLTGESLFRADSNLQTIHRVRRAEVTSQLLRVKDLMPGLDKVLYRTLSLNPRHRYQRAMMLREDLRGLMSGYSFASIVDDTRAYIGPLLEAASPPGSAVAAAPDAPYGADNFIDLPETRIDADPMTTAAITAQALQERAARERSLVPLEEHHDTADHTESTSPQPIEVDPPTTLRRDAHPAAEDRDRPTIPSTDRAAAAVLAADRPLPFSPRPRTPDPEHTSYDALAPLMDAPDGEPGHRDRPSVTSELPANARPGARGESRATAFVPKDRGEARPTLEPPIAPSPTLAPPPRPVRGIDAPTPRASPTYVAATTAVPEDPPYVPPARPDPAPRRDPPAPVRMPESVIAPVPPPPTLSTIEQRDGPPISRPMAGPGFSRPMPGPDLKIPPPQPVTPPQAFAPAAPKAFTPTPYVPPLAPYDEEPEPPPRGNGLILGVAAFVGLGAVLACAGTAWLGYNWYASSSVLPEEVAAAPADLGSGAALMADGAPPRLEPIEEDPAEAIAAMAEGPAVVESTATLTAPAAAMAEPVAAPAPTVVASRIYDAPASTPAPTRTTSTRSAPAEERTVTYEAPASTRTTSRSSYEPVVVESSSARASTKTATAYTPPPEEEVVAAPALDVSVAEAPVSTIEPYAEDAKRGRLEADGIGALEAIDTTDPQYTRSRALLLMNAQKKGDDTGTRRYLDQLMRLPENLYNPVYLTDYARWYANHGEYDRAIEKASLAERHWARLPPELVFSKKAEIYEIQAASWQGKFYKSSGDVELLEHAITDWERYRRHVGTKSREDLQKRADAQIAKLNDIRSRLE